MNRCGNIVRIGSPSICGCGHCAFGVDEVFLSFAYIVHGHCHDTWKFYVVFVNGVLYVVLWIALHLPSLPGGLSLSSHSCLVQCFNVALLQSLMLRPTCFPVACRLSRHASA